MSSSVIDPEVSLERGRIRSVNGSISFIPAIFGSLIAAIVVNALLEAKPIPQFCELLLAQSDTNIIHANPETKT